MSWKRTLPIVVLAEAMLFAGWLLAGVLSPGQAPVTERPEVAAEAAEREIEGSQADAAPARIEAQFVRVILADPIEGAGPSGIVPDVLVGEAGAAELPPSLSLTAIEGVAVLPPLARVDEVPEPKPEPGTSEVAEGHQATAKAADPVAKPGVEGIAAVDEHPASRATVVAPSGTSGEASAYEDDAAGGSPESVLAVRDLNDREPVALTPSRPPVPIQRSSVPMPSSAVTDSGTASLVEATLVEEPLRRYSPELSESDLQSIEISYGRVNAKQSLPAVARATKLEDVVLARAQDNTVLRFLANGGLDYRIYRESDPERLILEFPGVTDGWRQGSLLVGRAFVVRVRVESLDGGTRVILETIRPVEFTLERDSRGLALRLSQAPR